MDPQPDPDLSFRHYLQPLFDLQILVSRVRDEIKVLAALHDSIPDFMPEPKWAIQRALLLTQRALHDLEIQEQVLINMIRNTLVYVYTETGRFPSALP